MAPLKIIDHRAFGETIFPEERTKMSERKQKVIVGCHSDDFN
jgi:hypothetical protein